MPNFLGEFQEIARLVGVRRDPRLRRGDPWGSVCGSQGQARLDGAGSHRVPAAEEAATSPVAADAQGRGVG